MSLRFRIEDKEVRESLKAISEPNTYKDILHQISLKGARLYRANLPPGKLRKSVTSYYSGLSATVGSTSPIAHIIEFGHKAFKMKAPTRNHKRVYVVSSDFKFTTANQPAVPGKFPLTRAFQSLLTEAPDMFRLGVIKAMRRS